MAAVGIKGLMFWFSR